MCQIVFEKLMGNFAWTIMYGLRVIILLMDGCIETLMLLSQTALQAHSDFLQHC